VFRSSLQKGQETPVRLTTGQAFAWRVLQGKFCGRDFCEAIAGGKISMENRPKKK